MRGTARMGMTITAMVTRMRMTAMDMMITAMVTTMNRMKARP